jgi:hypothetical protein
LERTLSILRSLCDSDPVSPADFSLSVHNALAGLLSIASKNSQGHTAISAGPDTFAYGLIEAISMLSDGSKESVLLVYFEDVMPPPYDDDNEASETAVALAAVITAPTNRQGDIALTYEPLEQMLPVGSASAQCLAFIGFLLSDKREKQYRSDRIEWRWQRCV